MRRVFRSVPCIFIILALVTACDRRSREPVILSIAADSVIRMVSDTAPDGTITVNCKFALNGKVEGPEGEFAIVRGGRVQYMWWENAIPGPVYEWTQDAAARFWLDSLIAAGDTRISAEHGLGQSQPARLVRGTVTFDYNATNNDSTRTTNAWNFYCH